MHLTGMPFESIRWSDVEPTQHPGDVGFALWRTKKFGELRVRLVEYSPGYVADHWCEKGHVVLCVEGELHTELKDGRTFTLGPGVSYVVADGASSHRSTAPKGAKLFIVD